MATISKELMKRFEDRYLWGKREMKTLGQIAFEELVGQQGYRDAWEAAAQAVRQATIDECALAAENTATTLLPSGSFLSERCAQAIRALKDKK